MIFDFLQNIMATHMKDSLCVISKSNIIALYLGILSQFFVNVESEFYPSVQWTTTNENFYCANNEPADSGLYLKVPPTTKLNVVCPNPGIIEKKLINNVPDGLLHENLIMVEEEDYKNCRYNISKPRETTRILINCTFSKSTPLQYYLLVFQELSGHDDFIKFVPGKNYTFISTSDGTKNSLSSNKGPGHCRDKKNSLHMKMKVYVCKPEEECNDTVMNLCDTEPQKNMKEFKASKTSQPPPCEVSAYKICAIVGFSLWVITLCILMYCIFCKDYCKTKSATLVQEQPRNVTNDDVKCHYEYLESKKCPICNEEQRNEKERCNGFANNKVCHYENLNCKFCPKCKNEEINRGFLAQSDEEVKEIKRLEIMQSPPFMTDISNRMKPRELPPLTGNRRGALENCPTA